jgi:hypothetical protein
MKAETDEGTVPAIPDRDCSILCVSSLLPFAVAQTRALCRRVQASRSGVQIIVGLWDFEGGAEKGRDRLGTGCSAVVTTTLSETLGQIRTMARSEIAETLVQPAKS